MLAVVEELDPQPGGRIRMTLTYEDPAAAGKTTAHTDTYSGRFMELVPGRLVVEMLEFESDDPALRGEMTITISLRDHHGATELTATHDGLPAAVSEEDNRLGWEMSLAKLAALVEA
jgi:uncharacterized protein YndB with AHSA1/START domain